MNDPLDYANAFLRVHYDTDCARLLAPIDAQAPQGDMLRGTPLWQGIRRARESDDASLPQGPWVKRLKRAAWSEVAAAALQALALRGKDLQLAIWLAEALLHEHGFAGLAAGTVVIDGLCKRYWRTMYPMLVSDDAEHRANLIRWFNEKLLAPVRLVPLTTPGAEPPNADDEARVFTWADFALARRSQQHKGAGGKGDGGKDASGDGPTPDELEKALAATPDDALSAANSALAHAGAALVQFGFTLDGCFEGNAPGVGQLSGLLEQIDAFVATELRRRGIEPEPKAAGLVANAPGGACIGAGTGMGTPADLELTHTPSATNTARCFTTSASATLLATGIPAPVSVDARHEWENGAERMPACPPALVSRRRAYGQLVEAAELLAEIEPHSPVPYLVRRAIEWGSLNTAQLYDTLFIQNQGQLNLFELLGLAAPQTNEAS